MKNMFLTFHPMLIGIVLTILFVNLKLDNVVPWSWIECFLPLITGVTLKAIMFTVAYIFTELDKNNQQ